MTDADSIEILLECFSHVPVHRIVVVDDPTFGQLAKVHVAEDDLEKAIGFDGEIAKQAAMRSGIDVEVVIDRPDDRCLTN